MEPRELLPRVPGVSERPSDLNIPVVPGVSYDLKPLQFLGFLGSLGSVVTGPGVPGYPRDLNIPRWSLGTSWTLTSLKSMEILGTLSALPSLEYLGS